MNCRDIFERGIKFHHYCNTAYPLRATSLKQYELHDEDAISRLVKSNIEAQKEICLYVHIPFCQSRCKFCEYVVLNERPDEEMQDTYVRYLLKEIRLYKEIIGVKPVVGYDLGGGTPAFLSEKNLLLITESIDLLLLRLHLMFTECSRLLIRPANMEESVFLKAEVW